MSARFFAFDTETTGLSKEQDQIISIAMVLLDGSLNELSRKVIYALPSVEVHPKAAAVNGYNTEEWINRGAVTQDTMFMEVRDFLKGYKDLLPLGHNVGFDIDFLRALFERHMTRLTALSYHKVDTVTAAIFYDMLKFGKLGSQYKLTELTARFGIQHEDAHDALGDVMACIKLFRLLYHSAGGEDLLPPPTLHSKLMRKEGSDWLFRAGKHKDRSVTELAKEKPDYIQWVLKNVDDLSDEQREYLVTISANA